MKLNVSNKAEWGELHLALSARKEIVQARLEPAKKLGTCPDVVESCIRRLGALRALEVQIDSEQLIRLPGEPL
jgi:hypothetical protein